MLWRTTLGFIIATGFGGIITNPLQATKFLHGSEERLNAECISRNVHRMDPIRRGVNSQGLGFQSFMNMKTM